jgi:dinuclear metal center YbgI/SA1388 family protein
MKIRDITTLLEKTAPLNLQEDYDNAGLITGNPDWECSSVLICLDATPEVIREAVSKKVNLVVAHHPILFRGIKKINGSDYVQQAIIEAIKNDIAIYAIHTNLDNVLGGVNGRMADKLGLINRRILSPMKGRLRKLAIFVPDSHRESLMEALFAAGAGHIGNYSECAFASQGTGSFKPMEGASPYSGEPGKRQQEPEHRMEVIFPDWLQSRVLRAMRSAHPYEEIAHDIYPLENQLQDIGSGIIGQLKEPTDINSFLKDLNRIFNVPVIRHTAIVKKNIQKIALCGGAGSFLTSIAKLEGADLFITADVKYHEFFDADNQLVIADIGHYESEQFTIELLAEILTRNFPNFAVLKTEVNTNPVQYFKG